MKTQLTKMIAMMNPSNAELVTSFCNGVSSKIFTLDFSPSSPFPGGGILVARGLMMEG